MTINFCVKKFIKFTDSYDAESMGNGVQRPTRDIEVSEGGREACTPCRHMERVDKGHLGIECHRRLSNTSKRDPLQHQRPSENAFSREQEALLREGK